MERQYTSTGPPTRSFLQWQSGKVKPLGLLIVICLVLAGSFMLGKKQGWIGGADSGDGGLAITKLLKDQPLNVGIVTWPGYIPGIWYNNGLSPNEESRFQTEQDVQVQFHILDDPGTALQSFKSGAIDMLWTTQDCTPTFIGALKAQNPKTFILIDKSRGGDVVMVTPDIKTVNDLRERTIAVALRSPSHTFLLKMLETASMAPEDVQIVEVSSAIEAAQFFKARRVDAAVIWSPDDEDILATMPGQARVLTSTQDASEIIMDVLIVSDIALQKRKKDLTKFAKGWFTAVAELNASSAKLGQAARFAAKPEQFAAAFIAKSQYKAYLCTYGDNVNFFGLNQNFSGITGEQLYSGMIRTYQDAKMLDSNPPPWQQVSTVDIIAALDLSPTGLHGPEKPKIFKPRTAAQVAHVPKLSTKRVSVQFATGQSQLSAEMQTLLTTEFHGEGVSSAQAFQNMRYLITGNTDNTGGHAMNVSLSKKRADAVVSFLQKICHCDKNRFTADGKGPDNPIASNDTDSGRAQNRRTDIELIPD